MEKSIKTDKDDNLIKTMFELGAHFGFSRRRRHPSVSPFLYGYKNNSVIIDLEQTKIALNRAKEFMFDLGRQRDVVLFVGSKPEARVAIKKASIGLAMPYVALRWIGGTLTNFKQIRKRVDHLLWLETAETTGELAKYTKKERLLFAKERKNLARFFEGLTGMDKLPKVILVIDPIEEATAVAEARQLGITVVAIANSDCDIRPIDYPIIANDTAKASIDFFVGALAESYKSGLKEAPAKTETEAEAKTETAAKAEKPAVAKMSERMTESVK